MPQNNTSINGNNSQKKTRRRKRKRPSKHNNNNVQTSDNIHISTEESISNSPPSSNSNMSFSSFMETKTNTQLSSHPNLSKSELENIHIREKKICFLRQLPQYLCDKSILSSDLWFGQFVPRQINIDKQQAHILYYSESNAEKAIQFAKSKGLHANFGTKRYCQTFIETGKECDKYYCTFAHKWCKPDEIVSAELKFKKPIYKIEPSVGTNIMKKLENENEDLRNECKKLRGELTIWKIKHNVLNDKYKKLQLKICINIYKYKTWTCEQVYEWIISENNSNECTCFKKFANQLFYKNMKKEGIDGLCLQDLKEHDIYRLGITDFKAKKCLIKCINGLIIKNSTTNDGDNDEQID